MRLHLVIQRLDIPLTRILWSTPTRAPTPAPPAFSNQPSAASSFTAAPSQGREYSTGSSFNTALTSFRSDGYTIAQLLADVNELVPLETQADENGERGQWGLEDYVVELCGSECLHFMEVESLLREGDEIVIRPLDYDELAARRLAGRHQVSADGTHLIDGLPFGRRQLKRSVSARPPIPIPPRNKRRRIEAGYWGRDASVTTDREVRALPRLEAGSVRGDTGLTPVERDETLDRTPGVDTAQVEADNEQTDVREGEPQRSPPLVDADAQHRNAQVHKSRRKDSLHSKKETASPEKGAEVKSLAGVSKSARSVRSSSDSEWSWSSSSSSVESEESSDDSDDSDSVSSSSVSSSSISFSTSSTSTSDESSSEFDSDAYVKPIKAKPKPIVSKPPASETLHKQARKAMNPPGAGTRRTKHSNVRNKLRKRLAKLKETGVLHKDANFEDLRAWDKHGIVNIPKAVQHEKTNEKTIEPATNDQSEFEKKRAQLLRDIASGGVDVAPRKEKQIVQDEAEAPGLKSNHDDSNSTAQAKADDSSSVVPSAEASADMGPPKRTSKLDLASTRRLLFGSLGLRAPKNNKEVERAREKLAEKLMKPKPTPKEMNLTEDEALKVESRVPKPVENWQDVIVLKAVECVYEDVQLPPPPFPFVQRWDADSQAEIRELRRKQNSKGKKRKRKSRNYEQDEYEEYGGYQVYGGEENMDHSAGDLLLSYSENENAKQATVSDRGEARIEVTEQVAESHAMDTDAEDLPLLPDDISSLPEASENDIKPGAILAFQQLELSKETNWQPLVSNYRTAIVEEVNESEIRVRLAKRDREERSTDDEEDEGPRHYSKFEMPGYDEGQGEDDGIRELDISELREPKLLRPAPDVDSSEVMAEKSQENGLPEPAPGPVLRIAAELEPAQVSSPTRREISQLIAKAGFRSAIDSDLNIPVEPDIPADVGPAMDKEDHNREPEAHEGSPDVKSPAFLGFESSPAPEINHSSPAPEINRSSNPDPSEPPASFPAVPGDSGKSLLPPSAPLTSANNSAQNGRQPLVMPSDDGLQYITDGDNTALGGDIADTSLTPRASSPRHDEPAEDQSQSSELTELDLPSSVPPTVELNETEDKRPRSAGDSSVVANPFYEADDMDDFPSLDELIASTAPPRNSEPEPPRPTPAERKALSSPPPVPASPMRPKKKDNTQTQERRDDKVGDKDNDKDQDKDELNAKRKKATRREKLNRRREKRAAEKAKFSAHKKAKAKAKISESQQEQPSLSQIPEGSMVVDLTISSDADPDFSPGGSGSDSAFDESQDLPRGPGWVKKQRVVKTRSMSRKDKEGDSSPPRRSGRSIV